MDVSNLRTGRWRRVMAIGAAAVAVAASQTGAASAATDPIWVATPISGQAGVTSAILTPTTDSFGDVFGYDSDTGSVFELLPNAITGDFEKVDLFAPLLPPTAITVDAAGTIYTLESNQTGDGSVITKWIYNQQSTGYDQRTIATVDFPLTGLAVMPNGDILTYLTGGGSLLKYPWSSETQGYGELSIGPSLPAKIEPTKVTSVNLVPDADGDVFATVRDSDLNSYLVELPASSADQPSVLQSDVGGSPRTLTSLTRDAAGSLFVAVNGANGFTIERITSQGVDTVIRNVEDAGESYVRGLAATGTDALIYDSSAGLQTLVTGRTASEPTNVGVQFTDTGATISWQAPYDLGNPEITGYRVYRVTGAGAQTQSTEVCSGDFSNPVPVDTYSRPAMRKAHHGKRGATVDPVSETTDPVTGSTYSCDVTGLTDGTTYRYWVRAVNDAGYSKPGTIKFTKVTPVAFTTDLPRISGPTPDGVVTMTVAASGTPSPRLVWQRSVDGGDTWKNAKTEKNATTITRGYSAKLEGSQFRVVAYQKGQEPVFSSVTTVHD